MGREAKAGLLGALFGGVAGQVGLGIANVFGMNASPDGAVTTTLAGIFCGFLVGWSIAGHKENKRDEEAVKSCRQILGLEPAPQQRNVIVESQRFGEMDENIAVQLEVTEHMAPEKFADQRASALYRNPGTLFFSGDFTRHDIN